MALHKFNLRMLAEDLVRVRRPDDRERYAASQRQARIDPNPHQIDAVIFALRRLREGGCILADEVGLGKTIEAGLVIAQSRAEGAQRILLIVPKSLIGQWQNELRHLFGIQAREDHANFVAPGVYLTEPMEIEANAEVDIGIGDVAQVQIRGGRRGAQEIVRDLDTRWSDEAAPHLAASGVEDLDGLAAKVEDAQALDAAVKIKDMELESLLGQLASLGDSAGKLVQ